MLDADSVALEAVRSNIPTAAASEETEKNRLHLSDGWCHVDPGLRFDLVVSNPPVHSGIADDMAVVDDLVRGGQFSMEES